MDRLNFCMLSGVQSKKVMSRFPVFQGIRSFTRHRSPELVQAVQVAKLHQTVVHFFTCGSSREDVNGRKKAAGNCGKLR